MVEVFKNRDFRRNCLRNSIFANNLDFGHILRKSRFWSKCAKISILFKICENLDFGRNLRKSRLGSKFAKNLDFGGSFPILVEIF